MNKNEELKFTQFFIGWLNEKYNYDYEAMSNNNEGKIDTEVDVYAKSKSKKFKQLNFQLITSEGIILQDLACSRKEYQKTKKVTMISRDLKSEDWIKGAINKKENNYPAKIKKSLILLIQKDFGSLFNENYFNENFKDYKGSDFKGIYLIHCPSLKINFSHPHDGQILPIKDFIKQ